MKTVNMKTGSRTRLLLKLSLLPWLRSPLLQLLMLLAVAQLFLGVWFCASIDHEVARTVSFASRARWITVQMKSENSPIDDIRKLADEIPNPPLVEELKIETVLKQMETEEPEMVQTVLSMGKEGLELIPKVVLLRGEVPDSVLDAIRKLADVNQVDVSPVHHARLLNFYKHLQLEMRIALGMILFLMAVMILGIQRIQWRDLREVKDNLRTFGAGNWVSRFPMLMSLLMLVGLSGVTSLLEWFYLRPAVFERNTFLGELSIDRAMHFPWTAALASSVAVLWVILILSLMGRDASE
jgi:hypothetical protein